MNTNLFASTTHLSVEDEDDRPSESSWVASSKLPSSVHLLEDLKRHTVAGVDSGPRPLLGGIFLAM